VAHDEQFPDIPEAVYGLADLLYDTGQKAEGQALVDEFQKRKTIRIHY